MHCVLVADDSRPFAEMLRASLEDAGFQVVTAYSGPAALAAMEHNDVDIAVLDVLMPGISGDAVAHRLQQLDPDRPAQAVPPRGAGRSGTPPREVTSPEKRNSRSGRQRSPRFARTVAP